VIRWQPGRQGTGYFKLKLLESQRLQFDCYILKYPSGEMVPSHKDRVATGWRHFRLNIVLKKAIEGGFFYYSNSRTWHVGRRVVLFRPDITLHRVSEIKKGTRYVLSIGWLRHDN